MKSQKDVIYLGTILDAINEYCEKRGVDVKKDVLIWGLSKYDPDETLEELKISGAELSAKDKINSAMSHLLNAAIIEAKERKTDRRPTIYNINPNPEERWYKVDTHILCKKCGMDTAGSIILNKKTLTVEDDSGFAFDAQICDTCMKL